jgi:hypothetical protein
MNRTEHQKRKKSIMNTILGAAVAASLLTLVAPTAAWSAPGDPVTIKRVETAPALWETGIPGDMSIAFENQADTTAKVVVFRITDDQGREMVIDDVGTFAKGILIRHDFRVRDLGDNGKAQVVEVQFVDGSTWQGQPALRSEPRRQASAGESFRAPMSYAL